MHAFMDDLLPEPREPNGATLIVFSFLLGTSLSTIMSLACCGYFQYRKRRMRKMLVIPGTPSHSVLRAQMPLDK